MKRFLTIFVSMFVTVIIGLAGESVTVGTSSVIILPKRSKEKPPAWVGNTNTYAVGQYVSHKGRSYLVTVGGIATNLAPVHNAGSVARDGVTYRYIKPGLRTTGIIVNDSTNVLYLAENGEEAVLNAGIRLNALGGVYIAEEDNQDEVKGIAGVAGSNATVSDR